MVLTGDQHQRFTNALISAFPDYARLEMMVRFRRGMNLSADVGEGPLRKVAFDLIEVAEAEGWTYELVLAARELNPGNPLLLSFAQELGLAPAAPLKQELERIIKQGSGFLDVTQWHQRFGKILGQVCRVEIQTERGMTYGTGFLLGPDVIMTNYHVIESLRNSSGARPEDVVFRFDYKRLPDGTTVNAGTEYHLLDGDETKWLIDFSTKGATDSASALSAEVPLPTELDYALLRTAEQPGNDPVGAHAQPAAPPRRWIELPAEQRDIATGETLFIVQHPAGGPLQLSPPGEVTGWNANRTRVRYNASTDPGSSGSPCFDVNWNLVAIHQSGDMRVQPEYNQGIPLLAIAGLLKERGILDQLGAPSGSEEETPPAPPNPGDGSDPEPDPPLESCWRIFPPKWQCWKQYTLMVAGMLGALVATMLLADYLDDGPNETVRAHDFTASDTFAPIADVMHDDERDIDVRFFADYDNDNEQWAMWSPDDFKVGSIESPDPGAPVRNSIISVDARVLYSEGVYVAIACRYSEITIDGKLHTQRYQLSVNPWNGQFRLQRRVGDDPGILVPWTAHDSIKRGQELNKLQLDCRGDTISASINGQAVASVTDDQLPAGNACLITSRTGNETGPLEVRFDNLEIRIPA